MSVFRGSPWQIGHGQMSYGLGGLFRSLARAVMPLVKRGAKALGKSALNTGTNVLKNVVAGKDLKQAIKARGKEALTDAKDKAINRLQTFTQTGNGKRTKKGPTSPGPAEPTENWGGLNHNYNPPPPHIFVP